MQKITGKALQQSSDLAAFPLAQIERLASYTTLRSLRRNQILFDQDEKAEFVYILLSGVVRLSYFTDDRETVVALVPAGELFGLDAMVPSARQPFRAVAFESCTVGQIKPRYLIETLLGISYQTYLSWHSSAIVPRWSMHVHCVKGIGLDLRRRLALELLNLAEGFGKRHDGGGVYIDLNISHEILAAI